MEERKGGKQIAEREGKERIYRCTETDMSSKAQTYYFIYHKCITDLPVDSICRTSVLFLASALNECLDLDYTSYLRKSLLTRLPHAFQNLLTSPQGVPGLGSFGPWLCHIPLCLSISPSVHSLTVTDLSLGELCQELQISMVRCSRS